MSAELIADVASVYHVRNFLKRNVVPYGEGGRPAKQLIMIHSLLRNLPVPQARLAKDIMFQRTATLNVADTTQ